MADDFTVTVFSKTFNVYDVFPRHRKTLLNYAVPLFALCVSSGFIVQIFIMKAMEIGLVLSPAIFIICLGSIAIGEAFEVNSAANTLTDALKARKPLGKGDVDAILTVDSVLPRITLYYLLLAILLGAIGLTLPVTYTPVVSSIGFVFGRIVQLTVDAGYPTFYLVPFSVALAAFLLMSVAGKAKDRFLNLSSEGNPHIDTLRDTFDVQKRVISWTGHHEGIAYKDGPDPRLIQRNEDKDEK